MTCAAPCEQVMVRGFKGMVEKGHPSVVELYNKVTPAPSLLNFPTRANDAVSLTLTIR